MFIIDGLKDKQLGRIVHNPASMAEYNHLVSPTSPAGQSKQGWKFEMLSQPLESKLFPTCDVCRSLRKGEITTLDILRPLRYA